MLIKMLMTIYKYLAYLMTFLTYFIFAVGASELLRTICTHSGRIVAYLLTYLLILFLPVSFYVFLQLHKEKIEFETSEAKYNFVIGLIAVLILGFFHIASPNLDAFFQVVGTEIVILVIFAVALNIYHMKRGT